MMGLLGVGALYGNVKQTLGKKKGELVPRMGRKTRRSFTVRSAGVFVNTRFEANGPGRS